MPGREKEYEAYQAQLAEQGGPAAGPAFVPPPIDEERRNRSPGMVNNFYEVDQSDFKRSYGSGAAPPPVPGTPAPPVGQPPVPAASATTTDDGLQARMFAAESAAESAAGSAAGSASASAQPPPTPEDETETEWTRGRGAVASEDEAELTARVAQLERSNERLQVALSGVREREEAARMLAEEAAAKEAAISLRLKTLEIALSGVRLTENIIDGSPNASALSAADLAAAAAIGGLSGVQLMPDLPNPSAAAKVAEPPAAKVTRPPAAAPKPPAEPPAAKLAGPPAAKPAEPPAAKAAEPPAVVPAPPAEPPAADEPPPPPPKKSVAVTKSVATKGGTGAISSLSPISRRVSMPVKVARIREKLGLAPGDGSLVAAVNEATAKAEVPNEGGPLAAQVDRLMAKLFGDGDSEA